MLSARLFISINGEYDLKAAAVLAVEALVSAFMVSNADNVDKAARLTDAISAYLLPARSR